MWCGPIRLGVLKLNSKLSRLLCAVGAAAFVTACSHSAGTTIPLPSQRAAQKIQQPIGGGGGDSPPTGSSYINTQCSASDSTCAGPWQNGQMGTDSWETQSPSGNGHWQQSLICSDVVTCSSFGYQNTIAHYETTWAWDQSGYGGPNDVNVADTDYSPSCDAFNNPDFPNGCTIADNLATLGKHAQSGANCLGSGLAIGAVPGGGGDTYANQIVNISYIKASGLANNISNIFGWVYQTGDNTFYLQPNVTVTISGGLPFAQLGVGAGTPWVKINGTGPADLVNGMQNIASIMGVALPTPFGKAIGSNIKFTTQPCWMYNWDGKYLASKKRRV